MLADVYAKADSWDNFIGTTLMSMTKSGNNCRYFRDMGILEFLGNRALG